MFLRTHLNDALIFPVPLALWLVLRRLRGEIPIGRFVAGLGILIAAQFLLFPEIAASASFVGALAFLLGLAFTAGDVRRNLRALVSQYWQATQWPWLCSLLTCTTCSPSPMREDRFLTRSCSVLTC